jgi:hypothetical protein
MAGLQTACIELMIVISNLNISSGESSQCLLALFQRFAYK